MRERFEQIVEAVAARFEYRTDADLYGKPEWWTELKEVDGKLIGDCEDYCITIANQCAAAGIPLSALRRLQRRRRAHSPALPIHKPAPLKRKRVAPQLNF